MTSAEASAMEGVDADCYSGGGTTVDDNSMNWEIADEVGEVASNLTAQKIVSAVPVGETEVYVGDSDMESFSFESEEEDQTDEKGSPELSTGFDIKVLQTAMEASADALDMVAGKDVVMIAGKTGAGKSTLIQGIAGKRIHIIEHKTTFSGDVATKAAYDAENPLPSFEIGHSKRSKTSSINALVRGTGRNEIVYLDTPGVEDTSGVEMDIATAALLSQVAKRCKSLRFVILIHCASLIEDRGGAFRSVLKFARAFVRDFSESKSSFMFLFTHAGDITEMAESLEDARKHLHEEIIRTAEGTKDDEVLAVLKFIRHSLKKNYPFVQIFHPIDMDYSELTSFVENKLKKVSDLTLARSPSLTLAAKLKLDSAAQSLVQQLRVALRNSSQDVGQVSDIRKTLQTLSDFIDVDCFRHATVDSKAIIGEHTEILRSSISDHVSRGTSSDLEFNEEHIQALKENLLQLQELEPLHSFNYTLHIMEKSLLQFTDEIGTKTCNFKSFHKDLKKVSVWAQGFKEFAPVYARTCTMIAEFVHGLSTNLSDVDVSSLDKLSDEEICIFVHDLSNLNATCEQLTQFSATCIDVENAVLLKDSAMQKLECVLSSWSANAANFAKDNNFIKYEDDLEAIAKHVYSLETIRASMGSALKDHLPDFYRLEEQVMTTMKELENQVIGRFNLCCAEMRGKSFDPSWKLQLFWMQAVCNRFDGMKDVCWRQLKSSFYSIIDTIKSSLYRVSGELDTMSIMVADHSGMISGENFAKELVSLENCKWVDVFLAAGQQFVAECCDRVRRVVDARIQKKSVELNFMHRNLAVNGRSSPKLIQDIGRMLPELREIDQYTYNLDGIVTESYCSLASMCVARLERYASDLGTLAKKCLVYWASNIPNSRIGYMRSITRKLNGVLANVEAMLTIGASDVVEQKAREIRSEIHDGFAKFKKAAQSEFSTFDGNFGNKTAFLVTIQAFRGCPYVESQLIDYKKAQKHIRDLISMEAAKLETSIEASSNWDQIDESLVRFRNASVLDRFIGGEVSSRLHTLQRLREHKEHQVDDLMVTMIRNHDYRGIRIFLVPMADSKDQVKNQKYQSHQIEISSSLKDIRNEVDRLVDADSTLGANSLSVAKKIDVLVAANSELRNILSSHLNLAYEVQKLRRRMSDILCQYTKQMIQAMKEKDFIQVVVNRCQGSMFLSDMRQHLSLYEVLKFESASEKSKLVIEAMPQYLDKFFMSNFEDGDDLCKSMESLKQAKDMGSYPKLAEIYDTNKKSLESKIRDTVKLVQTVVSEYQCFDDMITYVHKLHRQLLGALKEHCSSVLVTECEHFIEDLRRQKKCTDRFLELDGKGYEQNMESLSLQLNRLSSTCRWDWWSKNNMTYKRLCTDLLEKIEGRFNHAQVALKARDFVSVQESIEFLELVQKKAAKHVEAVGSRVQGIRDGCIDAFQKLCDEAKQILSSDNCIQFKEIFPDYRGFVLHIPCVMQSPTGQRSYSLVNQMLLESLEKAVLALRHLIEAEVLESSHLRSQVLHTRSWGNFLADYMTLLHEEVNNMDKQAKQNKCLDKIHKLCWKHFNFGRDLSKIKYCAILGILPSSSEADINKAYKEKARRYHPDKYNLSDGGETFREVKDAHEKLLTMSHLTREDREQPFDEILIRLGEKLRDHARLFMSDQRYDMMEKLLSELPNIAILDDLVVPKLNSDEIISSVYALVKGCVEQSRVEVDSNWSARNYKDLNGVLSTLKNMERHLKAYAQIFPKSWNTGICSTIEAEIESLGQKASACLQSHAIAKQRQGDFRRCFIQMGFVLIELPSFKSFTKSVMSCVLERCLDAGWGYGYLFELGLSLQKGDDASSEDESRVAQMIVTEFTHFKEVLVMVWNEEVSQKPAEDVVKYIRGEVNLTSTQIEALDVDHRQLLDSFMSYEREYKSLVGDYIKPDADLNALVHKTVALARRVAPPNNCNGWGDDLKEKIPALLAGVFSLLTVVKSGASYNRIEEATGSSDFGEKLLLKPHNIQVLSLLVMLGCGKSGRASLDNQLMQIRTGEGKSMILGAASVMLALLGFRVRTVCYSEYLSDRDFRLFEDVFNRFGLSNYITYSKITAFAEDATAAKGDIRSLTESLLRNTISVPQPCANNARLTSNISADLINQGGDVADIEGSNVDTDPRAGIMMMSADNDGSNAGSATRTSHEHEEPQQQQMANNNQHSNHSFNNGGGGGSAAAAGGVLGEGIPPLYHSSGTLGDKMTVDNYSAVSLAAVTPGIRELNSVASNAGKRDEILLVDEVDVFFGPEFYGQTYNQVVEFREPEIEEILTSIWNAWSQGGRRLKLNDIQSMPEYTRLLVKLSSFSFLVDNEISLMLDQVSKVDDFPYYLDIDTDRIGYKVMDSISYDATYGYSTCFAYLKESPKLKNKGTLAKVLAMPISCGQFSYANISPHRILGVSGTLNALSKDEREILLKYGLSKFIYVPSVYGASNFDFDKAGEGVYFENNKSDFFHRISAEITSSTKAKRAVIVFFQDRAKLDEFVGSPSYRQLNRHKQQLTENMPTTEKSYVISKAATAGQITLSTAVFGRGTDFFCKDEVVESNGGVHIIQTFLSEELSEEIQIQGRTARQGKRGTYQLVLLEPELESQFGVPVGEKDKIPRKDLYNWLCSVRLLKHSKRRKLMEENLLKATEKDSATHTYFDHLLAHNITEAKKQFESLYRLVKKSPMPSSLTLDIGFAIDVTGSMVPYSNCVVSTTASLIAGPNSILEKLKSTFPEIEFKLRVGCLGFRDIADKNNQFQDKEWNAGGHFTDNIPHALQCIKSVCGDANGGADIAEDHIAAIYHCSNNWNHTDDWTSEIKCLILFSDAPSHGFVAPLFSGNSSYDNYPAYHPDGLNMNDAISSLISKDIDLFFCSFDPNATARTEEELSQSMKTHPDSKSDHGITRIPMVPAGHLQTKRHIIFVLDESSSMTSSWSGVVVAYRQYIDKRMKCQSDSDLVSVVQFDDISRITVRNKSLSTSPNQLIQRQQGTQFHPAALDACKLARETPPSHSPIIIFMSDGEANDTSAAAREFSILNDHITRASGKDLELHVIAFGNGASHAQLEEIARASKAGKVHASASIADLVSVFVSIATNENVATVLESEIAKRMSEAVSDKLSLEYFGS